MLSGVVVSAGSARRCNEPIYTAYDTYLTYLSSGAEYVWLP